MTHEIWTLSLIGDRGFPLKSRVFAGTRGECLETASKFSPTGPNVYLVAVGYDCRVGPDLHEGNRIR